MEVISARLNLDRHWRSEDLKRNRRCSPLNLIPAEARGLPLLRQFFDDLTGFALEPPLVRLARIEEMNHLIMDLDVWEIVDRDFALERVNGVKPIPLRWVDINKGSETSEEYRSRLVVMETKRWSTTIAPEGKKERSSVPHHP